tara:strand:- start:1945 stop:2415 length:471 start_codon:yes stop_codon:yes gene_type:complete
MKYILKLNLALMLVLNSSAQAQNPIMRLSEVLAFEEERIDRPNWRQLEEMEYQIYEAFNLFNQRSEFEISCSRATRNGSNFYRSCTPFFLDEAIRENHTAWRQGSEELLPRRQLISELNEEFESMDSIFNELLAKNAQVKQLFGLYIATVAESTTN